MVYEFYSIGCSTDRDCAANLERFIPFDQVSTKIRSYPFNFQECRRYPTGAIADKLNHNNNGCLCPNYLTSAMVVIDDAGNKFVTCTGVDQGSIYFFILQGLIAIVQIVLSLRCLFILVYHGYALMDNLLHQFNLILNRGKVASNGARRYKMTPVKVNCLIAIFYLFLSCICFAIFKISNIISFAYGLPDILSPSGEQLRLSEYSWKRFKQVVSSFLELSVLHLTIMWMSVTPILFTDEIHAAQEKSRCFKPLWYKRVIYLAEIVIIVPTIALIYNPENDIYLIQIIIGIVVVYEVSWGCANMTRILRFIASKFGDAQQAVRAASTENERNSGRILIETADKIDSLARKFRICGSVTVLAYLSLNIVLNRNKLYVSISTISNQKGHIYELADILHSILAILLFNFLHETIFGVKKKTVDVLSSPQKADIISIGDLPPEEIKKLQNMNSRLSALESSHIHGST